MKQIQTTDKKFARIVISVTLLFVAMCGTFMNMTSASIEINHDTIQAITVQPIDEPDPVVCGLKDVECDGEIIVQAPTKPVEKPIKVKIATISNNSKPTRKGASKVVQERIDYAWEISHDKDFIYTLDTENAGTWDINIRSYIKGANGHYDYGLCQFNKGYHPHIVNDPQFKDAGWQLDQCWKAYKNGTRFYGYDVRWKSINNFTW